jgi:mannosyl-oligosaccharide alpha-1,2-mannosidase
MRHFHMVRATRLFVFIAVPLTWLCFRWLGRPSDVVDGTFEVPVPSDTYQLGKGRFEVPPNEAIPPSIRWTPTPEHFPVNNMVSLPQRKAQRLPRVQHVFAQESEAAKADRMVKLDTIKSAFQRSWKAYQSKAWMHDELCPISGKFKDPFNGSGCTLIDSLDTLWIMNMKDEFSEAVSAIRELDFKTSVRKDIPLKKTTMKDLGGLLSAYDISGGKHKILLNKAVELGEILMGAFDTPNHMPLLHLEWDP